MTTATWRERLGRRLNTSPANNASWLMAVVILAVAIPASDKIASNQVFFAAHGVSAVGLGGPPGGRPDRRMAVLDA